MSDEPENCDKEWEYDAEFDAGKKFAQKKVLELIDEVIQAYGDISFVEKDYSEDDLALQKTLVAAQINALKFARSWVTSGGHTDFDGNRACLPW